MFSVDQVEWAIETFSTKSTLDPHRFAYYTIKLHVSLSTFYTSALSTCSLGVKWRLLNTTWTAN
jgi:hypothetical protein